MSGFVSWLAFRWRGLLPRRFLFLALLSRRTQFSGPLQSDFVFLLELRLLIRLTFHLRELRRFEQQVGLVRPGRLVIRIKLDRVLGFGETLLHTHLRLIEILLLLRLLVRDGRFVIGRVDGGHLVGRQLGDLERAIPVFTRQDDVSFRAFRRLGLIARCAGADPRTQFIVLLDSAVEIGDRLVSLFVFRVPVEQFLISVNRFLGFSDIVRRLYAGAILRVNRARYEHGRRLVVRVQLLRPARILFRLDEPALAIGTRSLIQLVLPPNSVNDSAPGTSSNKDRQKEDDPGLSSFHLYVTPIFIKADRLPAIPPGSRPRP